MVRIPVRAVGEVTDHPKPVARPPITGKEIALVPWIFQQPWFWTGVFGTAS